MLFVDTIYVLVEIIDILILLLHWFEEAAIQFNQFFAYLLKS